MAGWEAKIQKNIMKIKVNALDDQETEFVDVDQVMSMYMEQFHKLKEKKQIDILKGVGTLIKENDIQGADLGIIDIEQLVRDLLPHKSPSPSVHFAKKMTICRAYIYSLVCGSNTDGIDPEEFLAGCNRFGIDNPTPIINKVLALYGVPEELEKDFKKLVEKYKGQ